MVNANSKIPFNRLTQWYIDLLNSTPAAIYRTTLEGKIVYCNSAMAQIFGFTSVHDLINHQEINLYRDKKDRGNLVKAIIERGHIRDLPLPFIKNDGTTFMCAISVKPLFDDDGMMVFFDVVLIEIAEEKTNEKAIHIKELKQCTNDFLFTIDFQLQLQDINQAGAEFLGLHKKALLKRPFLDFIAPQHHDLFFQFVSSIISAGAEEEILTVMDKNSTGHHFEFKGSLINKDKKPGHIKIMALDITERMRHQTELLNRERLQGVLEMAGGVAHNLNQPLMIMNNLLAEISCGLKPDDHKFHKMTRINDQLKKLNAIAKKIGAIAKYAAMDYVGGEKIVDIDKASLMDE